MSFAVNQLIGFGARRLAAGGTETLIPYGTYSALIGDMTAQGGLAGAFNGSNADAFSLGASSHPTARTSHYVGKDWGSGVTKTITRYTVYAPTDIGWGNNAAHTFTISLYGSNSAPANSSDGTQLATTAGLPYSVNAVHNVASGIDISTSYRYHWIRLVPSSSASGFIDEIDFYETI